MGPALISIDRRQILAGTTEETLKNHADFYELDGDEDNKKVFEGMIDKGGPTEGEDTGHGEYLAEYVHLHFNEAIWKVS